MWKFPLGAVELGMDGAVTVEMPPRAKIVHFGIRGTSLMIWAEVHPGRDEPTEQRTFAVVGTGDGAVPDHAQHIATYFDGPSVWHVYELTDVRF